MRIKISTEELYKMYQTGMSLAEIGENVGVTGGAIQSRFKRKRLTIRTWKEANAVALKRKRRIPRAISGPDHWLWKGGKERRNYRNKVQKEICDQCQSKQNLCIHHKDFDHYNNQPENLQILCVSCHLSFHKKAFWDAKKNGETPPKSNCPIGWNR